MNMNVSLRHLDEMQPWNDRQHLLECVAVAEEAPDVMTFTFRSDKANWFRYNAGQFVTLELPAGDEPLMRTYTLSSSPSRPFSIAVTVKAQKGSVGTRWMFDNLRPGMRLRAFGPLGDFSYARHSGPKYLFISAGSGVTPMVSMTRDMSDRAPDSDIAFLHCARSPDDIMFRRELDGLTHVMPKLSLAYIVETARPRDGWAGFRGRVDLAKIASLAPDFMERTVFCCGPEPFMAAVRATLEKAGFDMDRFHQESFQPAIAEPVVVDVAEGGERAATIGFALAGKDIPCKPGQTILQASRAGGVRIPAACEGGICGTCRVLKLSGEVEMNHNGGLLDDEVEEGYILACCSRPKTDIVIEA